MLTRGLSVRLSVTLRYSMYRSGLTHCNTFLAYFSPIIVVFLVPNITAKFGRDAYMWGRLYKFRDSIFVYYYK